MLLFMAPLLCAASELSMSYDVLEPMPCEMPMRDISDAIRTTSVMKQTAVQWASTHDVSDWHAPQWRQSTPATRVPANSMAKDYRFAIPYMSVTWYARYRYDSQIRLPTFVASVVQSVVQLHLTKYVYLTEDVMYTITNVTNIPLLGTVLIFSELSVDSTGAMRNKNKVAFATLPWYVDFLTGPIQDRLKRSLREYTHVLSQNLCLGSKNHLPIKTPSTVAIPSLSPT